VKVASKQIPTQGLHLEGEEDCPIQELETEEFVALALCITTSMSALQARAVGDGSLSQPVELRAYVLEKFVHEIEVGCVAVHMEFLGRKLVDLTPLLREIFC